MVCKNKIIKNFVIMLGITLLATLVICVTCPPMAEAKDHKVGLGTEVKWDPIQKELSLISGTWNHDTLSDVLMLHCLKSKKIKKEDVHKLYIEGFNYIDEWAIFSYDNLSRIEIKEPVTTAIRLSENSICYNPKLEELKLGGIEWKDTDNNPVNGRCIYKNKKLSKIIMNFDNYNKYQNSLNLDKLDQVMPENGTDNKSMGPICRHCQLSAYDENGVWRASREYKTNFETGKAYWDDI